MKTAEALLAQIQEMVGTFVPVEINMRAGGRIQAATTLRSGRQVHGTGDTVAEALEALYVLSLELSLV